MKLIEDLTDISGKSPNGSQEIIKTDLQELSQRFGDKRWPELLVGEVLSLEDEDLIEEKSWSPY